MSEEAYNLFDILLKSFIIIGGIWAYWKYHHSVEREFRRPLWDRQLSVLFQLCEATGRIATTVPGDPERDASERTFWMLYFGPVRVIDDEAFGRSLMRFKVDLENQRNNHVLMARSVELAHACRGLVRNNWRGTLDDMIPYITYEDRRQRHLY